MSDNINEAFDKVMVILLEFEPSGAAEILVRAHARMTAKCECEYDVNIESMLQSYCDAFRDLHKIERRLA